MTTPTNPHPFAPTEELFRNILDLVKLVIPTGDSENAEKAKTLLGLAERHLKETSDAFQVQQQQIAELTGKALAEDSHNQHKLVEDLRKKVTAVDNQLNKAKKDSYSSQISGTKDNILVRTTKDSKAVSEYIGQTIRRYDKNVKLPDFSVHLISSSRETAKTPNKSATRFVKDRYLTSPRAQCPHPSCTKCTWVLTTKTCSLKDLPLEETLGWPRTRNLILAFLMTFHSF